MPALFVFLFKVNVALLIFCLGYFMVLRHLTFYTLNRVYLTGAIILATLYPLIDLDGFLQRHQQLTIPAQTIIINWKAPVQNIIEQAVYWHWAVIIFWLGAALFATRLFMQLLSLYKLYKHSKPGIIQHHNVRIINADVSPFSFWQSIYINPHNLNANDLKSILQHEQVHVKEWHTIDILLTEISLIFYWFNPGVWLMKKAVRENIEFITDRKILQNGADSKAYQYSLLNVSFNVTPSAGITNHFNFSTLKKRIIMMNAKRSSNVNLMRYAFLMPAVLICLLAFGVSKAELIKKSKVAYKKIAAAVQNSDTIPAVKPRVKITNVKLKQSDQLVDTIKTPKAITVALLRNDTVKMINVKTNDTMVYYINNIKAPKADLTKIKPDDITSINVNKNINTITVATKNTPSTLTTTDNTPTSVHLTTQNNVVVKSYRINGLSVLPAVGKYYVSKINGTTAVDNSTASSIDHIADKLILIDGKEVPKNNMQKFNELPASSIESISVYRGKEMIDKYGDKAKNGVISIVTKK